MVASVKGVKFKEISKGQFTTDDGQVINYCNLVQKGELVDPKWSLNPELAQDLEAIEEGTELNLTVELSFNSRRGKFDLGKIVAYKVAK
jgi:hypothetical protein